MASAQGGQQFSSVIERHDPDLPVYLMVPNAVPGAFGQTHTFIVEANINDSPVGRRSIKPWGDGRWFMELTKVHCARLGIGVGDRITITVNPTEEEPAELTGSIIAHGLGDRWSKLSAARRRALSEHVFDARRPETRKSRIERIVGGLRGET